MYSAQAIERATTTQVWVSKETGKKPPSADVIVGSVATTF